MTYIVELCRIGQDIPLSTWSAHCGLPMDYPTAHDQLIALERGLPWLHEPDSGEYLRVVPDGSVS